MVPICETTLDVESGGVVYKLKYLTDRDRIVRYSKLAAAETRERDKFIAQARVEIGPDDTEDMIKARAYELLAQYRDDNPECSIDIMDAYIDLFVVGWNNPVPFPSDGRPSQCLRYYSKMDLFSAIQLRLVELIGLTVDEAKN